MKTAVDFANFLTQTATYMNREELLFFMSGRFESMPNDDWIRGLQIGVAVLQQEAAMKGEFLDVREALARLAKVSWREVDDEIVDDISSFPTGLSTAIH